MHKIKALSSQRKRGAIIESLAFYDMREQLPEAMLFRCLVSVLVVHTHEGSKDCDDKGGRRTGR